MRVGMHVSIAGGICRAIDRAEESRAETIQLFASAPQRWAVRFPEPEETAQFRTRCEAAGIYPVFLHALYLINLGSPSPEVVRKSVESLTSYMSVAEQIGAAGVVLHTGSHKGRGLDAVLEQVTEAVGRVLTRSDQKIWLIIENCAGMGNEIGATFSELGQLVKSVNDHRVKVCLDTQHTFAAGYDLTTAQGLDEMLAEFEREVGLERLVVVHANDSKVPCGAAVDRHENIGEGYIGIEAFERILSHPALQETPFILEVPGIDGHGPDKANLDLLKRMRPAVAPRVRE